MCVCAEAASLADSFSLYAHLSVCLFLLFVSPMTPAGHLSHLFYLASSLHTHTYTFAHTQTHIHNFPEAHLPLRLSHSVSCSAQYLFLSLHFKKKFPFKSTRAKMNNFLLPAGGPAGTCVCAVCVYLCMSAQMYCKCTSMRTQLYTSALKRNTRHHMKEVCVQFILLCTDCVTTRTLCVCFPPHGAYRRIYVVW